jgi:sugar lactone lactonase YvrE
MRASLRCTFIFILATGAACDGNSVAPTPLPPGPEILPGLWMASGSPSEILRLDPSQLLENASLEPATKLTTSSAGLFTLNSIAFDTDGTMWVASEDESLVLAFSPSAANATGPAPAAVVLRPKAGSISGPSSLAFDRQHNLWVANYTNGTIARFDRADLSTSGTPTPGVVISGLGHPTSLAFDAVGALWVSDNQANTVSRFLVGQLLSSGNKEAAVVLSSNANSLVNPTGIAFDATGNLWVANTGNHTVASFSIAQRGATGSPVPALVLSPGNSPLIVPVALAFDAEGSLWVMGGAGGLKKFEPDALDGEGSQQSSVKILVSDHILFWSIAFWPKPAGLPLN